MSPGRLVAVVGPSGVGKDSVMAGLHQAMPQMHLVRRVITRAPGLGGEDYDAVSSDAFKAMADAGEFAIQWAAHGLRYGIPVTVKQHLDAGTGCLVNFSRKALAEAAALFPHLTVLNVTAQPETLARRLAARDRETAEEIAKRLAQAEKPLPPEINVLHLANDGPLSQTVAKAVALLQPPGP